MERAKDLAFSGSAIDGVVSLPAAARDITENLNFSLSSFVDITSGSSIAPPIQLITGSITASYDLTTSYDKDTADIVVHSLTAIHGGFAPRLHLVDRLPGIRRSPERP